MNWIFQPLFGEKPKNTQGVETSPVTEKPTQSASSTPPVMQPQQVPAVIAATKLKMAKNQLEGFVSDNKTFILIAVILIILVVLAIVIYNQHKQNASLALVKKKLKKLK